MAVASAHQFNLSESFRMKLSDEGAAGTQDQFIRPPLAVRSSISGPIRGSLVSDQCSVGTRLNQLDKPNPEYIKPLRVDLAVVFFTGNPSPVRRSI